MDQDFEKFRPALLDLARQLVGVAESEDAVQDAIMSYLTSPACTGRGMHADLDLALRTVCGGIKRARSRRSEVHLLDWSDVPEAPDVHQAELSAVAWERWETARLSRCQRAAMTLHLEGLSTEEIAERMMVSARTARHHLQGARETLETNMVTLSEFRTAEEMFAYCAQVTVYRSPRKVGSCLTDAQRRSE